jgi:DtxR family transcriptional regulator, iron-dependent repressor
VCPPQGPGKASYTDADMEELSEATQEYLESIYWLYESGIERTQANLARALRVSQPSASEMLKRLVDEGLVERDEHKLINFTPRGREVAERIVARHRLVEAYLVKVMGIPWDDVHEEAHALEHSISPRLESKMLEMIGDVHTCPHGHPIGDYPREPGEPIPAVPVGSRITVLRLENEAEEVLHYMKQHGIEPGDVYEVVERSGDPAAPVTVLRATDGSPHEVDDQIARTVSVRIDARGDGPISTLVAGSAELQLLGESRWGM